MTFYRHAASFFYLLLMRSCFVHRLYCFHYLYAVLPTIAYFHFRCWILRSHLIQYRSKSQGGGAAGKPCKSSVRELMSFASISINGIIVLQFLYFGYHLFDTTQGLHGYSNRSCFCDRSFCPKMTAWPVITRGCHKQINWSILGAWRGDWPPVDKKLITGGVNSNSIGIKNPFENRPKIRSNTDLLLIHNSLTAFRVEYRHYCGNHLYRGL